jgi:hypothetical protein
MFDAPLVQREPVGRLTPPAVPPPWRVTDRDLSILQAIAHFRHVTCDQIATLLGMSRRAARRRLYLLWAHGLVLRPSQQHVYLAHLYAEGTPSLVYGLTRKGAALVADRPGLDAERLRWQFGKITPAFLAHTIETAEAMIAFHLAARAQGLQLIDHAELLPYFPPATRASPRPFRLSITLTRAGKELSLAVTPDRLFSLLPDATSRFNFALELDRGHMPIARRSLSGTSFARKVMTYFAAHQQKRHTQVWGFAGFRVLTITPSEPRLAHMLDRQREIVGGKGSNMFLFSTPARIAASGPLGPAWISGKGETVSLLPAATPGER